MTILHREIAKSGGSEPLRFHERFDVSEQFVHVAGL